MNTVRSGVMLCVFAAILSWPMASICAQDRTLKDNPELAAFFEAEVSKLEQQNELTRFKTLAEWQEERPQLREQLFYMLGLSPRPEKTPLEARTTGVTEEAEFVVERVHFQSMPGLYVTGNFYRPKTFEGKLPTILYLCGHGRVARDGVSFGNKTYYQHHGAWFARNGYACLSIDSLQLGEIEAIHHGTYNLDRWWWNSRGYTPAGVEAWNCIRALDYLETRPEVDAAKFGVTGRSGGGAYSWWIAALDDRIACAVPVAGITSLRDHVITGCVEGHCDCMYMLNTYRWDYATVAALVAPRPLLISNTDKDSIFPLEGVVDIYRQVRHIYQLHDASDKLGLQITEGPHEDTQELHIHAFRWFNRFLKNDEAMIEKLAVKFFEPAQLRVFADLPTDEINTKIDEVFVSAAALPDIGDVLRDQQGWFDRSLTELRDRCFRAWPEESHTESSGPAGEDSRLLTQIDTSDIDPLIRSISFQSQPGVKLSMQVFLASDKQLTEMTSVVLVVEGSDDFESQFSAGPDEGHSCVAWLSPRGLASSAWQGDERKQTQIQRRFQLIGTTVDAMRVWDIRRAIQTLRAQCPKLKQLTIEAGEGAETLVLLASLFEPPVDEIIVPNVALDRDHQPSILNLTRSLAPETLPVLAAMRSKLTTTTKVADASFAAELTRNPNWSGKSIEFGSP